MMKHDDIAIHEALAETWRNAMKTSVIVESSGKTLEKSRQLMSRHDLVQRNSVKVIRASRDVLS
ncbi:hypothetical protein [uncultured Tateyamaria sp.]|uniref:hypothetical protein n=1 Tax=uncultured Tateyamaria sp. TaxID=455651 RepID=UPI0026033054|nr:hypothetical protein [uncultured Tateyamaria sp.]